MFASLSPLAVLSPWRFFSFSPAPQNFAAMTNALLQQDVSSWKPSKHLSAAFSEVSQEEEPNKKLLEFFQKSVAQGMDHPKDLPQILHVLSSSFKKGQVSAAIDHCLGGEHPFRDLLPSWEKHKTRWEGISVSLTKNSYRPSFSIPFISSFLETFWSAIDDLDSSQRYSSIWEKYLILEILYRCSSLPFQLAKYLQIYFLTPLKVYLLVAVGSFLTLGLARLYQTYQQRPDRLVYIEKCQPVNPSVPPQPKPWNQLLSNIQQEGARIFLTGKPGSGKTSLIESLLYRQKTEPGLKKLVFVHLKIADLVTDQSFGYGEILEKIKRRMEAWQDHLVLVVDEAQRLQEHRLLDTFRTKIMDPLPRLRCLFATTSAELAPFTSNTPFVRRITQISVEEPTKEDLLHILRCEQRKYLDWPMAEELLNAIVEKVLSRADQNPEPAIGAICRATQLLKNTMERYLEKVKSNYSLPGLQKAQESLNHAESTLAEKILQGIENIGAEKEQVETLKQEVATQKRLNTEHQGRVQTIAPFFQAHKWAKERSTSLAQTLLKTPDKDAARNELLLLDFVVLPALAKKIRALAVETVALPTGVVP